MPVRKPPTPAANTRVRKPAARKSAPSPAAGSAVAAPGAAPARETRPVKAAPAAKSPKPAKAIKPVKPGKSAKIPKIRRKPVRDSFTMPEADFALIATLKARALAARREVKKSELLRAGLHALAMLTTPELVAAIAQLEPVKLGRPKKD